MFDEEQRLKKGGGGGEIPGLWVMFSGVYFWEESWCFDLIGFDSATKRSRGGRMLSERSLLLIFSNMAWLWKWSNNGEPASGWLWQSSQIQPEGSLVDELKLNLQLTLLTGAWYELHHADALKHICWGFLQMPTKAEINDREAETAGALNHFCGLNLMFSCIEEPWPQ